MKNSSSLSHFIELVYCVTLKTCYFVIPNAYSSKLPTDHKKIFEPRHEDWTPPHIEGKSWDLLEK